MSILDDLIRKKGQKTKEQLAQTKNIMGYVELSEADRAKYNALLNKVNPDSKMNKAFGDAGFSETAKNRQTIAFTVYMLSEKNMSIQDLLKFHPGSAGFDEAMRDFHDFLESHPVKGEGVDIEKNVGDWTALFMKAATKIGEFTIPQINYADPEQVKQHSYEFFRLSEIQINFSQEFERVTCGERKAFAVKKAGGAGKLNEVIGIPTNAHHFTAMFLDAYNPDYIDQKLEKEIKEETLNKLALDRATFIYSIGKTAGGKKIVDIGKEKSVDSLFGMIAMAIKPDFRFRPGEAKQFFENKGLSPEREAEFIDSMNRNRELLRQTYNGTFAYNTTKTLYTEIPEDIAAVSKELAYLHSYSDQPEEMMKELCSEEYTATRDKIKTIFTAILGNDTRSQLWKMAKVENPINIFKIGGKTPEELWSDKAKILSDGEKELYYQMNILREIQYGKQDVTCDVYLINDRFKLAPPKPMRIAKSEKTIYAEAAALKQVNNLHEKLKGILEELDATGKTGSGTFTDMRNSLKKCIRLTNFMEGQGARMDQILDGLKELEQNSKNYYGAHTGIRGTFCAYKDNGKKRLSISDNLQNSLQFEAEKLKMISADHDFMLDKNMEKDDLVYAGYNLKNIWRHLKQTAKMRGINLTDEMITENVVRPIDRNVESVEKKGEFLQTLQAIKNSDEVSKSEYFLNMAEGPFGSKSVKLAQKVVFREYVKKIRTAGNSASDARLEDLEQEINRPEFNTEFHNKVQKLLSDKRFMNLSLEKPDTCYAEWQKLMRQDASEKHRELSDIDPTYIRLKEEYPQDFEKRWDNAEDRIRNWSKEWKKTNVPAQIKFVKEELFAGLPNNDPARGIVAIDDHKKLNQELAELATVETEICERMGEILTKAILKDLYKKGKTDRLMELAIAPDSVKKMQKYITEGLEDSGQFRTKASATQMISDINGLKLKAIGYITDRERRANQAGNAAGMERKAASAERKPAMGRAM